MNHPTLLCCPESMRPHVAEVLAGEYDLPHHLELVTPPRHVLDLGANVGAFSAWARAKWPGAEILAYEPHPENADLFRQNHLLDENIYLRVAAVRDRVGAVELRIGQDNCGEHSAFDLGEQTSETITVPGVGAQSIRAADVIKIDTEGAEAEILNTIDLREAKMIAYEWHGRLLRDRCMAIIKARTKLHCVREVVTSVDRGIAVWALPEAVRMVEKVPSSKFGRAHLASSIQVSSLPEKKETVTSLFLAVPIYGGVDPHFHESCLALMSAKERPYALRIHSYVGDSLVSRARNRLAAEFLRSDATHLFFVDSDLIFSPEHVARIASHAARGVPIVAGLYPKKQRELGWVCNVLETPTEPDKFDLQPVKYAGTGFLCISREVLMHMMAAHPEARYDPDDGDAWQGDLWEFFPVGIRECPETGRRRLLSEDWWFCQRALDLGYKIMMDTRVVCKHVGAMVYPLDGIETFAKPVN